MTGPPLVSVLLTSYNRQELLSSSIESVLAQTFGDFELVIADDHSTDATVEIARRYERLDSRVRVVVNDKNLGDYGNRNRAASLARGALMKYHDSDDLMYPHCLQVMVAMLQAEPRAAFGLSSGWSWPGGPCPMLITPRMAYQREFLGQGMFMCGPSGAIFRTDAFHQLGGWVDAGSPSDHLFWLKACARVNVILLPADLFWYRVHPGQGISTTRVKRQIAQLAAAEWEALNSPECPLTPEEREQAKRNRAYSLARKVLRDLRVGHIDLAWYRLSAASLGVGDWMKYLRRPRRSIMAGTPLNEAGDYVVPPAALGRP